MRAAGSNPSVDATGSSIHAIAGTDPGARTAAEQVSMFCRGSADVFAVTRCTLETITAAAETAIFVLVTPDRALREAAESSARYGEGRQLGTLDGVPIAWKDLFDLEGEVTRAGSRILCDVPAQTDAVLVQRLAHAGAVTVGKLNLTEFAFSVLGLNPHFGTPRNPWGHDPRVPGGSSSGCGVAVARGIVPLAIGTDTSGSVRVPAAFNGIVGFKPSGGRWPLGGCFPLSKTLDTAGVLCRTLSDAVEVDAVARDAVGSSRGTCDVAGLRLVVPTNAVWEGCQPAVTANAEAALRRLSDAGALVDRRPVPVLDSVLELNARFGTLVALEAYRLHEARLSKDSAQMDRQVAARMRAGSSIGHHAEQAIRAGRDRLILELDELFDGDTLLAFPTVPHVAPPIAPLEADDGLFAATNAMTMRNTMLGNFLDWCSVSIPSGFDGEGLPTGLLLSGGPGLDDHLLAAALAAEPFIRGFPPNTSRRSAVDIGNNSLEAS
ncbi:amidase [Sphingosinicellaceae bacterium]|nr:amidase [Sphingosinicellaceae bacterium]